MGKEIRLTIFIYITAGVLALGYAISSLVSSQIPLVSPVGPNFSIVQPVKNPEIPNYLVYGFLPYWSLESADYIQLDKVTDIAYFAIQINADGTIKTKDPEGYAEPGLNRWNESQALEMLIAGAKASGVNFAVTIISHDDDASYSFLDCRNCWDRALSEMVNLMNDKGIKDVNLDFELVNDAKEGYDLKYSQFAAFVNTELDKRFGESKVVVSVHADSILKPRITDIETMARAADYLFIMAYDFHRPDSENAGPVAPINGAGSLSEYDITTMLSDFLKVAPANKLILGVPYYGYNWLVTNTGEYAERIPGTDELGYSISQTYSAIADTRLKYNPPILWDATGQVPYFTYFNTDYGTTRQVYFEDERSLAIKYDLAKVRGLAGVGIWALGYDGGYQELWDLLGKTL